MGVRPVASIAFAERIRFVDLAAQARELEPALSSAIQAVIERGDFILGQEVEHFEREFASYCGVRYGVGVDSGFSALELALRGVEIGNGDEVITQANTFIATVGPILMVGARPVLTDCDSKGDMNPDAVAAAISPRTRAVIPVHLFGRIGPIDPILALAAKHGIAVIEDACQAHGATWRARRAGSFGLAAAFSFYPAKNLGAFGDGGMLVTSSEAIATAARTMRNYGQTAKYQHVTLPLNRRLDTVQAAVLRIKLPHLNSWNARRQELADAYREYLRVPSVTVPPAECPGRHVYHLFVIETELRDALRAHLTTRRIETGIHYPCPLHLQPTLRGLGYGMGAFPETERLATQSLSLPMYPELPLCQVEQVATAVRQYQQS